MGRDSHHTREGGGAIHSVGLAVHVAHGVCGDVCHRCHAVVHGLAGDGDGRQGASLAAGLGFVEGGTQDVRHKQSFRGTHAANCMNCVLFTGMEVATEPSKQTGENMAITSSLPGDMAMENMELPGMAASAVAPMCCMAGVLRLGY